MAPGADLGKDRPLPMPNGCSIEYVAFYQKNGKLLVSKSIFDKLGNIDKAALYSHEALYKVARFMSSIENSSSTRILNSHRFSDDASDDQISKLLNDFVWPEFEYLSRTYRPMIIEPNSNLSFNLEIMPLSPFGSFSGLKFVCVRPKHGGKYAHVDHNYTLQYGHDFGDTQVTDTNVSLSLKAEQCQMLITRSASSSSNNAQANIKLSMGNQVLLVKQAEIFATYVAPIYIRRTFHK